MSNYKYDIGDKVILTKDMNIVNECCNCRNDWMKSYNKLKNEVFTITRRRAGGLYSIKPRFPCYDLREVMLLPYNSCDIEEYRNN